MSDFKRRSGERGIALVIALLLTAVIGLMAAALSYTISSYLRNLAMVREKNQGYYVAYAGSEEVRSYLWNNNCIPPTWCGTLLASSATDPSYQMRSNNINNYMVLNANQNASSSTNYSWSFYLKDNDDGDGDYSNDNDGIILASVMAKDPNNNTTTTIEAMFIFTTNNSIYGQQGGAPDKSNYSPQGGPGANSGNLVQSAN